MMGAPAYAAPPVSEKYSVKTLLTATVSALALAGVAAPASAQHHHMPGMQMPAPKKAAPAKKTATQKMPAAKKAAAKAVKKPVARAKAKRPVSATKTVAPTPDPHAGHVVSAEPPTASAPAADPHAGHATAAPESSPAAPAPDHSQMDHSQMGHDPAASGDHGGHASMPAAYGPYPANREASGTAWQPDASEHTGLMATSGDWTLMAHGNLDFIYDWQGGPRGDDKLFAAGMIMGMARRPLGNGTLQFKGMFSPDPLMGKRGYPLLLATGETADGIEHLVDRQHPHDFFMELSASVSQNIGPKSSVFLYGGLPGEPAFGPPAFMHRESIMASPEAPISHHWLDSTHITFGVLTAGLVHDRVKVEVSRFNAREPDQHRWNIETGPLDSTAVRLSWNPTASLSLQGSWGHFKEPEQLEPDVNQKRLSASAMFARDIAPNWKLAGTLAWGRKSVKHHDEWLRDDAYVAEASLKHRAWTLFGRGEITENRELLEDEEHSEAYRVGKVSFGIVRDFKVAEHFSLGLGGLYSVNFVPDEIADLYGGNNPKGAMGFLRFKLH